MMLDVLQSLFKTQFQFSHMAGIINHLGNVLAILHTDYTKDGDAKNAAIDAVCQILQSCKDVPVAQPQSPSETQSS